MPEMAVAPQNLGNVLYIGPRWVRFFFLGGGVLDDWHVRLFGLTLDCYITLCLLCMQSPRTQFSN